MASTESLITCRHCNQDITVDSYRCSNCGGVQQRSSSFDLLAALLSFLAPPLGFWLKRRWVLGGAWILISIPLYPLIVTNYVWGYVQLVGLIAAIHAFYVKRG